MNKIINIIGYFNNTNIFLIISGSTLLPVIVIIISDIVPPNTGTANKKISKNMIIKIITIAFTLLLITFFGFTLYISFDVFIIE